MPIVISQSLVLSELVEGNPDAPLIGWHNLVTRDNIESDEEAAGYPATNLANPSTALPWKGETTSTQYITIDLGGADANYVGIARHNLGSGETVVSVEVSDGESPAAWTEIASEFVPGTDGPLIIPFGTETPPAIRIKLRPGSAVPQIAVIYVGNLLRLPRGVQPGIIPPTWAANDTAVTAISESGDYLGAVTIRRSLSYSVAVQYLNYGWWNTTMPGFIEHARARRPFFFAWLPASYPDEVGYAWTQSDIRPDAQLLAEGVVVGFSMDLRAVAL